jgi:hypothetical protein
MHANRRGVKVLQQVNPVDLFFWSDTSPAKPEAWKTVGRSKRLERGTLHIIHADSRPYSVTPANFKPGSSALISM